MCVIFTVCTKFCGDSEQSLTAAEVSEAKAREEAGEAGWETDCDKPSTS
jgi:hypothetical protein